MKKFMAKLSDVAALCERRFRRSQTAATFCVAATVVCCAYQGEASIEWDSTANNLTIPDNMPNAGAASDIYIQSSDSKLSGFVNPSVASVASVVFTISVGWDGDYTLILKHTDGTTSQSVTLLNMIGGGANASSGFTTVTLAVGNTDINSAPSSSGSAITGTWAPQGGVNFTGFQNIAPTGDWILYATDNHAGDQGKLASWALNLNVVPEPVNTALEIFGGAMGVLTLARSVKKLKFGKLKS
jgi:hypothetical protein